MLSTSAAAHFPTTRWTSILDAQRGAIPRELALEEVITRYWRPVYCYVRRKGVNAQEAEDAVQSVFAQLLEREFLTRLDPNRGSLRGFLRKATDHYLINAYQHRTAAKRGGPLPRIELDWREAEATLAGTPADPAAAFDREWALGIMERALERLRSEYTEGRRRGNVDAVLAFFGLGSPRTYAEAAAECRMSVSQFKASLHRARVRFRDLLAAEVADTGARDGGRELHSLFAALTAGS